ncbi:hypothetical protein F4777DRAFT_572195 [Nemania sp. FL0916]|nr:hypothetical protein F4777DRAFT_572195 [Nemania sp. FL0916]
MWQIGSGRGLFNWTIAKEQRRKSWRASTWQTRPGAKSSPLLESLRGPVLVAVRYNVTNPGT